MRLASRGAPTPFTLPVQQEVARETLMPLFPKTWASHVLRGEYQVVRIGKMSPKWWWLLDKEKGKGRKNGTKGNLWTIMRTSGETNTPPSWLPLFTYSRLRVGGRRQVYKNRKPRQIEASPLGSVHPHASKVCFPFVR